MPKTCRARSMTEAVIPRWHEEITGWWAGSGRPEETRRAWISAVDLKVLSGLSKRVNGILRDDGM